MVPDYHLEMLTEHHFAEIDKYSCKEQNYYRQDCQFLLQELAHRDLEDYLICRNDRRLESR